METTTAAAVGEGSYENPWLYQGTTFTSNDIDDKFGFVYCITNNTNGRQYIGRKYFWKFRTPRGKKRKVKSESDWKNYYGSCPELWETVNLIKSGHFSHGNKEMFEPLVNNLLNHDPFCVFADFSDYLDAQDRVDRAWKERERWNHMLSLIHI